ncbi:hypothetical protein ABEB36_000994 [Hypothenemus hampei]|uniref:Uncharacterized protein n=1 Tax=Hypothenemus hampei TaxID=57062 RepID=A0ABD1FD39_HYPHA
MRILIDGFDSYLEFDFDIEFQVSNRKLLGYVCFILNTVHIRGCAQSEISDSTRLVNEKHAISPFKARHKISANKGEIKKHVNYQSVDVKEVKFSRRERRIREQLFVGLIYILLVDGGTNRKIQAVLPIYERACTPCMSLECKILTATVIRERRYCIDSENFVNTLRGQRVGQQLV